MVSYAIVYRHGLRKFVADAKAAGVAGAIVPDLLVEESRDLAAICKAADFNLIQLVTPRRLVSGPSESPGPAPAFCITFGHRNHRRADRTAAVADRKRRLAAYANRTCRSASALASAGRST